MKNLMYTEYCVKEKGTDGIKKKRFFSKKNSFKLIICFRLSYGKRSFRRWSTTHKHNMQEMLSLKYASRTFLWSSIQKLHTYKLV